MGDDRVLLGSVSPPVRRPLSASVQDVRDAVGPERRVQKILAETAMRRFKL
jgi:hypothetical protein